MWRGLVELWEVTARQARAETAPVPDNSPFRNQALQTSADPRTTSTPEKLFPLILQIPNSLLPSPPVHKVPHQWTEDALARLAPGESIRTRTRTGQSYGHTIHAPRRPLVLALYHHGCPHHGQHNHGHEYGYIGADPLPPSATSTDAGRTLASTLVASLPAEQVMEVLLNLIIKQGENQHPAPGPLTPSPALTINVSGTKGQGAFFTDPGTCHSLVSWQHAFSKPLSRHHRERI